MKQTEVIEKVIGENHFYIRPFPAFVAANISGELAALLTPVIGGLAPVIMNSGNDNDNGNILDMEIEDAVPALTTAFSGLSGDKFERIMKKLLIDSRNISVESPSTDNMVTLMTYDIANEVFCGEVQDMFILCYEVIRLNFKGFFKKLGGRFGNLQEVIQRMTPSTADSEN